jgi:hypothetical protein
VRAGPHARTLLFWGVLTVTLLSLTLLAYFVRGGLHGMYADDYVYKYSAYDLATGRWRPEWNTTPERALSRLLAPNLANALPTYELPIRLGIVALQLLNLLLLGALAFRLTRSRWMALISAAFFLAPVFAAETILWFSAAVFFLAPLAFLLVGLHLILSCQSAKRQFPLLIGAVAAWCAMILFGESGFFVVLLVPAFVWLRDKAGAHSHVKPALIAAAATYILFGAYALLALRPAPVVAAHGENTFDPIYIARQRIPELLSGLADYARDWEPGGTFPEALNLGAREWLSSPAGSAALGLAICGVILTSALYPVRDSDIAAAGPSLGLFLLGILWMGLALAPDLFFVGLQISPRVLLFPSAGFALALTGLLGWLVDRLRGWRVVAIRGLMLMTGATVLLTSLTLAGLVVVYQLRWERDQTEVVALRTAVPDLPDVHVWVMPVGINERIVGPYVGHPTVLDQYLYSLFQIPWAAGPALRMEYDHGQLDVIIHDSVELTGVSYASNGEIDGLTFEGQGQTRQVPTQQLLAFTYLRDRVILFDHLIVAMPDGAQAQVELRLPAQVASPQTPTRSMTLKLAGGSP